MDVKFLLVLTTGLLLGTADDAVKKDLTKLEASWTATSVQYNGKEFLSDKFGLRFVIKGDIATVESTAEVKKEYAKMKLKIDPGTTPACMDLTVTAGIQKDAVMEAVYQVKDDELKICIRVLGKDRPGEFESPEGSSIALLVFKKDKP